MACGGPVRPSARGHGPMKQESMKWLEFGFSESRDFSRGEVQIFVVQKRYC